MFRAVRIGTLGFLAGVAAYFLWRPDVYFVAFLSLLFVVFSFVKRDAPRKIILGAVIFFGLGFVSALCSPGEKDSVFRDMEGKQTMVRGVVVKEPDVRENTVRLTVRSDDAKENLLVVTRKYPEFAYGDRLELSGKISAPENFANENGREFDYVSYLRKDMIFYEMAFPKISVTAKTQGNPLMAWLHSVKRVFLGGIARVLPEPDSGLVAGMLFGEKRGIGEDISEMFRAAGIIHIVVLSGYNITIVADFLIRFFAFFPRVAGMAAGALGIILFTLMTGSGASTVRASIMALLVIFARVTGRTEDSIHFLFVAAFAMVAVNRFILLYDPSFQLSFLATLGLFLLQEPFSRRLSFVTEKWGVRETLAGTLATQVFVLPLLLYQTGLLSVVSIPVNLLVLPAVPFAMFFGFFTGLFALASDTLAFLPGFFAHEITAYIFAVVSLAVKLPFAAINIPAFSPWFAAAAYMSIFLVLSRRPRRS